MNKLEIFAGFQAMRENGKIRIFSQNEEWIFASPGPLDAIWAQMENSRDVIPYWTELWPSSLALGDWLLLQKDNLKGRLCIDLGCGLGFTAILAENLKARVIGMDYLPEPLSWCRINARQNNAGRAIWVCGDWHKPPFRAACADLIWGADIIYEKEFFSPVLSFFEQCLKPGGKVWLAEPGRAIFYGFLRLLRQKGWLHEPVFTVKAKSLYKGEPCKTVRVWEIAPKLEKRPKKAPASSITGL